MLQPCYMPRVSRDVVFDELKSWYSNANDGIGADVKESGVAENAGSQSQVLSGPQSSPSTGSVENPWSGMLHAKVNFTSSSSVSHKGKDKVDDVPSIPNLSASHEDGENSGFKQSLNEEFGIPCIKTPGVRMGQATYKKC